MASYKRMGYNKQFADSNQTRYLRFKTTVQSVTGIPARICHLGIFGTPVSSSTRYTLQQPFDLTAPSDASEALNQEFRVEFAELSVFNSLSEACEVEIDSNVPLSGVETLCEHRNIDETGYLVATINIPASYDWTRHSIFNSAYQELSTVSGKVKFKAKGASNWTEQLFSYRIITTADTVTSTTNSIINAQTGTSQSFQIAGPVFSTEPTSVTVRIERNYRILDGVTSTDAFSDDGDIIITSITRTGNSIDFTVDLTPTFVHTFLENETLFLTFGITYTDMNSPELETIIQQRQEIQVIAATATNGGGGGGGGGGTNGGGGSNGGGGGGTNGNNAGSQESSQ